MTFCAWYRRSAGQRELCVMEMRANWWYSCVGIPLSYCGEVISGWGEERRGNRKEVNVDEKRPTGQQIEICWAGEEEPKEKPEGYTGFYERSSKASEAGTAACPSSRRRGAGRQLGQWCGQIETPREGGWRCETPDGKLLAAHNKARADFFSVPSSTQPLSMQFYIWPVNSMWVSMQPAVPRHRS